MKLTRESPIEEFAMEGPLALSVRSFNILKREGIHTVNQFLEITHQDLDSYRNMTAKCIIEIAEAQITVTKIVNRDVRQMLADFLENEVGPQGIEWSGAAEEVADKLLARFEIEVKE